MRMLALTATVLILSVGAQAKVWTTVYRCDEKTPLTPVDPNHPSAYQNIMIGTKLVVVISSDATLDFLGRLRFPDDGVMSLAGRGYDPERGTYPGSCLQAGGAEADVFPFIDLGAEGFDLATGWDPSPGGWFIFDYCAECVGTCSLELYDFFGNGTVPINVVSLTHVPSCDFNRDERIDFEDFARFASHYSPVPDSVVDDQAAWDLNADRVIDIGDLALFSGHWLEQINCADLPVDPNQPSGL